MKQILLLFIIILQSSFLIFSQGEIDNEEKVFFRNEKSWAFFIRNNGFGFNYMKGKRINAFRKYIWEVDMHYLKHHKELKTYYSTQSGGFVYGKTHFAWDTHYGVGFQHELFEKRDKNGVAIRGFYTAGPTVLLLKPIYYEVTDGVKIEDKKFNLITPIGYPYVIGRSSFFKGIEETKINPGAFVKGGLSFEYSKRDRHILALDLGMMASAYLNEFEIIWDAKTRFVYSMFISFRWGRVVRGGRMEGVEIEDELN